MGRRPAAVTDAGVVEIDAWLEWFYNAQVAVINANPDMLPDERMRALVAAEQLAAAVGQRMRDDYEQRRQAPR